MFLIKHSGFIQYNKNVVLFVVLFLLLTSCVNSQSFFKNKNSLNKQNYSLNKQKLLNLNNYQILGSLVCFFEKTKFYANFFWKQQDLPKKYQLLLTDIFGNRILEFIFKNNFLYLITKENKTYLINTQDNVIYKSILINVFIEEFSYWLIGLPGNATDFSFDKNNLLKTVNFKKNNKFWRLNYISYDMKKSPVLPKYFELQQDNLLMKFKINNWILKK